MNFPLLICVATPVLFIFSDENQKLKLLSQALLTLLSYVPYLY